MAYNGCGMKSLRTSKHRLIQPLNRLLNVMLFKYSTIRAMCVPSMSMCTHY